MEKIVHTIECHLCGQPFWLTRSQVTEHQQDPFTCERRGCSA